ncbi:rod shape-determining protein RodA [candidate division WWE3 bacterium]|nr:rod shape-determining protein RodA [candidate division WWE3 bacterium]
MDRLLSSVFKRFDPILLGACIALILIGLSTIQSTVIAGSARNPVLTFNLINIQILSISIGVLILFFLTVINYRYLMYIAIPLYGVINAVLIAVLLFASATRGTKGWFEIGGVNIQPSSLATVGLIICFAAFFIWIKDRINNPFYILLAALMAIIPAGLILVEPDIGNASVVMGVWVIMLHMTPIKANRLIPLYFIALVCMPLAWINLAQYQKDRIFTFMNPSLDPLGSGYNVTQSIIAVGSGQMGGRGWGRGTQSHLQFLPEQHTDFIFATFAEEQGFLGVLVILFLYGLLCWRILVVTQRSGDYFGQLICLGSLAWFSIHVLVNVGMNIGIAPVTGIPLPLVSYGGTAMLTALIAIGFVQSVSVHPESDAH